MYITKLILSIIRLFRYSKIISAAYDNDYIVEKISLALGAQFKRASFARLYAVLNPYIKDGNYSPEQIIEINEMGAEDNTQWMIKWTFERLNIIRNFITTENLLDALTYEMQDLGDSNYLFIIKPIILSDVTNNLWKALIELLIIVAIIVTVCIIFL